MKIQKSDILAILDFFEVTGDEKRKVQIDQIKSLHPRPYNQLVAFRLNNQHYFALIDDSAGDDTGYIIEQLNVDTATKVPTVVANPTADFETYGMPYEGKTVYLISVKSGDVRLDSHLAESDTSYSRSSWQKLIKNGHVKINGKVVFLPKYKVQPSDTVSVEKPNASDHSGQELTILYIDDDVIVVEKPVGVLTHAKNPLDQEFTVAEFFRKYTTVGLDSDRPGIVHRLDRDTSGVMIGARNQAAFDHLKTQFAERKVQKTYIAVTDGVVTTPHLKIDIPIGRNMSRPGSFIAKRDGKSAQTELKVLRSSAAHSLVELKPKTGRTHQLRVHLAHLATPIHGDRVYGRPAERLYLHAERLELTLPSGDKQVFRSAVPQIFMELIDEGRP